MKTLVFMPGCNLSAHNPKVTQGILNHLKNVYNKDIVKGIHNCCGKPLYLLGERDSFDKQISQLKNSLEERGATELVVACQNCYSTLKHRLNLPVLSLWPLLAQSFEVKTRFEGTVSIQDSCSIRGETHIHESIRLLVQNLGFAVEESLYNRENTLCCGQGGMVDVLNQKIANKALKLASDGMKASKVISYCGGCYQMFKRTDRESVYLGDLLFDRKVSQNNYLLNRYYNRYKTKKIIDQFNRNK